MLYAEYSSPSLLLSRNISTFAEYSSPYLSLYEKNMAMEEPEEDVLGDTQVMFGKDEKDLMAGE